MDNIWRVLLWIIEGNPAMAGGREAAIEWLIAKRWVLRLGGYYNLVPSEACERRFGDLAARGEAYHPTSQDDVDLRLGARRRGLRASLTGRWRPRSMIAGSEVDVSPQG